MDAKLIIQRKREIVEKYGEWTAHNIQLVDDIYTMGKRVVGDEIRLRRIMQTISDIAGKPFENIRVIDLACLEGLFAIELACHGAEVVAIEGREANIQKARFAKDVLSLSRLELVQDDVRNLSVEKYGRFDVVLCLGILYHLDCPDVFLFMERIAEVCRRHVIIESNVTTTGEKFHVYKGKKYWGRTHIEHSTGCAPEEMAKSLWASLDNPRSFHFTRPSLYNLLSNVGFTSLYECHSPPHLQERYGRITLLAMKGRRESLISSPIVNVLPEGSWPERGRVYHSIVKVARLMPDQIRRVITRMFLR